MNKFVTAILLMMATSVAWAGTPSYSQIEIGYSYTDITDFEKDSKAWNLGGSLELTNHIFLTGNSSRIKNDDLEDVNDIAIGLGYFSAFGENAAWHTSVQYVRRNIKHYDAYDGVRWIGGVRKNISENIEFYSNMNANYEDDWGTQVSLSVGTVFHIASGLGLHLDFTFESDSTITTGVRYTF